MEIGQANHLRDLLPPPAGVRVARLDDVASRVVHVQLTLAARELEDCLAARPRESTPVLLAQR